MRRYELTTGRLPKRSRCPTEPLLRQEDQFASRRFLLPPETSLGTASGEYNPTLDQCLINANRKSPINGNVKRHISPSARCRHLFVSAFSPIVPAAESKSRRISRQPKGISRP